jgi:pimeloyl-ACP methyl ester carboxylesterase
VFKEFKEFADGPGAGLSKAKCTIDLVTGIKMAYLEVGPADGKVVILLHGLTDSVRSWATTMAALHAADPSLRLFALDQRGHGDSSMPTGAGCPASPKSCFQMALFAADLAAFMDTMGVKQATIAGHSMGSFVAQQIALDRPDLAERVVLVASAASLKDNALVRDYLLHEPVLGSWKKGLAAKGITSPEAVWEATPRDADSRVDEWLSTNWVSDPVANQDFVKSILPETAVVKMGTWIGATEALLELDNSTRLANLTAPALVLWGTQDSVFFKDPHQSALIAALKTSRAPFVWKQYGKAPLPASGSQENDIGHNLQWEVPREVAADLLSFIKTGQPTADLHYAMPNPSGPSFTITTAAGQAVIVSGN